MTARACYTTAAVLVVLLVLGLWGLYSASANQCEAKGGKIYQGRDLICLTDDGRVIR